MTPTSGTLIMMSGADLAQLIEQAAERGAARALASAAKQAAAPSLAKVTRERDHARAALAGRAEPWVGSD